jgi:hypothetical protein
MGQQMNELKFGGRMFMFRILIERMRMDNRNPIHDMRVGKECNACQIRYKEYRKQAFQYVQIQLLHLSNLYGGQRYELKIL